MNYNVLQNVHIKQDSNFLSEGDTALLRRINLRRDRNKADYSSPAATVARRRIRFDTYFGAIIPSQWLDNTSVSNIGINFHISGSYEIHVWMEKRYGGRTLLFSTKHENDNEEHVEILDAQCHTDALVYVELTQLSETLTINFLRFITTTRASPIKLAIIMPTYKREAFVTRSLYQFRTNKELFGDTTLFLIDNARTLDLPEQTRDVRIIKNINSGGSGGFARGLMEVMEEEDFTHVLFMDDDGVFLPESIFRLINFFRFSKDYLNIVGGAMLSLYEKSHLIENGNYYSKLRTFPSLRDLDLKDRGSLFQYLIPPNINYFAWWFMGCSLEVFRQHGLPLPLFFRGDDQEYGFRLTQSGATFISLLGCGLWHEDFTTKYNIVSEYYIFRNGLIVSTLHENFSKYLAVIILLRVVLRDTLSLKYQLATYKLLAVRDFLKGPKLLMRTNPESHHADLIKNNTIDFRKLKNNELSMSKLKSPYKRSYLKILLSLLTLNGHLLPRIKREKISSPVKDREWATKSLFSRSVVALLFSQKVTYLNEKTLYGYIVTRDRKECFSLLLQLIKNCLQMLFRFDDVKKQYVRDYEEMTQPRFWKSWSELHTQQRVTRSRQ